MSVGTRSRSRKKSVNSRAISEKESFEHTDEEEEEEDDDASQ